MYARKLTKEELLASGITEVTTDGHVFVGEDEIFPTPNKAGYLMFNIYDFDENGNKIKIPHAKSVFGYIYKTRSIGLHRLMWAWHKGEVPNGMVVDHINNKHCDLEDYNLKNLDCTTQRHNVRKERTLSTREIKCQLSKPRSYYADKLAAFERDYEQAKLDKDADRTHKIRSVISQYQARLRYWDSHAEEAKEIINMENTTMELKTAKKLRTERIKALKALAKAAKQRGDLNRWHNLLRAANNYDAFPPEKILEIIAKEEKRNEK